MPYWCCMSSLVEIGGPVQMLKQWSESLAILLLWWFSCCSYWTAHFGITRYSDGGACERISPHLNNIPKINCSKRNLHQGFQKSHVKYNWPTTWSVCAGMDANHHLNLFNISEHGKERKIKCSRKWASINSTADLLSLCLSFSSSKSFQYLSTCLSFSFLSVHRAKLALSQLKLRTINVFFPCQ